MVLPRQACLHSRWVLAGDGTVPAGTFEPSTYLAQPDDEGSESRHPQPHVKLSRRAPDCLPAATLEHSYLVDSQIKGRPSIPRARER